MLYIPAVFTLDIVLVYMMYFLVQCEPFNPPAWCCLMLTRIPPISNCQQTVLSGERFLRGGNGIKTGTAPRFLNMKNGENTEKLGHSKFCLNRKVSTHTYQTSSCTHHPWHYFWYIVKEILIKKYLYSPLLSIKTPFL